MAKNRMPVSKATTADGLLKEIEGLILEEPKRYNQMFYIDRNATGPQAPQCGTIGCVAGWASVLRTSPANSFSCTSDKAKAVLGLSSLQAQELFNGSALENLPAGQKVLKSTGLAVANSPGTLAYARAGALHIRNFRRKYKAQLLATKLQPNVQERPMNANATSKTTKQQDAVLIALTRNYPRTIAGMSSDLGIPAASIRRTLSELKAAGYGVNERGYSSGLKEFTLGNRGF